MIGDRRSFSLRLLVALALSSALVSCGEERTQRATFRVAGPATGTCDIPAEVSDPCTTVVVTDAQTGEQIPIVAADDVERTTHFLLRFEGNVEPSFDIPLVEGQRVNVRVTVYENDGAARFGAYVEDVDPRAGPMTIRLYPFRQWSCPGARQGFPRALHGAARVGPHQVLIFGGVSGGDLDALSLRDPDALGGALPVEAIEVYDGRTHEFRTVPVQTPDGTPVNFRRALFDSYYVGAEEVGGRTLHRVRVIGGYTGGGGAALVHFDNLGTHGVDGTPLGPSENAETGTVVDLVYDPSGPVVTIEEVSLGATVVRGGPIHRSEFFGSGSTAPSLVTVSLSPDGNDFASRNNTYSLLRDGTAADEDRTLQQPRLGPAILATDAGFLVWGGNVTSTDAAATHGELFPHREGASELVPTPAGAPPPTAFHTATRSSEGEDRFLVAGGLLIDAETTSTQTLFNQVPPSPLYYLEVAAGGAIVTRRIDAPGHASTIYHSVTRIEGLGLVLIGGAGVEPVGSISGTGNRLEALTQAAAVRGASYTRLPDLALGRWGHTATPISGHRLLVVGGFTSNLDGSSPNAMRSVADAELLYWEPPPRDLLPGECENSETEMVDASVELPDAGLPPATDAGPPLADAGPPDAGSSADAGLPMDAGTMPTLDAGP